MEDLKIFDQFGQELNVLDIVYVYIQRKADQANKSEEEIYIGFYEWGGKKQLITCEAENNGYDAIDLINLNISDEIK